MAKVEFAPLIDSVRGRVGNLITKKYSYGHVLSSTPDMSRVKPSVQQETERRSMRPSSGFYRNLKSDPAGRAWLEKHARELGLPKPALARREFARLRREARDAGVVWAENFVPPISVLLSQIEAPVAPVVRGPQTTAWCW